MGKLNLQEKGGPTLEVLGSYRPLQDIHCQNLEMICGEGHDYQHIYTTYYLYVCTMYYVYVYTSA